MPAGQDLGGITGILTTLGMPVLLIVVFYFVLLRPQQKQKKARAEMMKNLKVGDRIKTIGGVFGRIAEIRDEYVTIETGRDKVKIVFDRNAVSTVEGGSDEANADLQ